MKLVAWNCNEGLARDLPAIRGLGADAAVLSEVPSDPPPDSLLESAPSWHWTADEVPSHGLALAGFTSDLEPYSCGTPSGVLSVAADHVSGLGLLGLCARKPNGTYAAEVVTSIRAHRDWLTSKPCVVAGDFNLIPGGDDDMRTGSCRAVFDELEAMGYVSAYHQTTGEPYGEETGASYFHYRHRDKGFLIDHCFVHRDLVPMITSFELGDYDTWVARTDAGAGHSDHVPLILDLALPA